MADQLSRVLAGRTRRDILARLPIQDASVGDPAATDHVSVQAVSEHLNVLAAGLVIRTRKAQRRTVHLEAAVFDLMTTRIERYRQQAEERYRRLDDVLADIDDSPTVQDRVQEGTAS